MKFESFIYETNPEVDKNFETVNQRPYLIIIILILLATIFWILDYQGVSVFFLITGLITITLNRLSLFKPKRRVTGLNKELIITDKNIKIGDVEVGFDQIEYLNIRINSYEGQIIGNSYHVEKSDGKNNFLEMSINGNASTVKFWLPAFNRVKTLRNIKFPENVNLIDQVR